MSDTLGKSRRDWVQACHFHDLTEKQVLKEVSKRVQEAQRASSGEPLVLLDLDSTLYEVGPRTHQILREWLDTSGAAKLAPVAKIVSQLQPKQVGYSIKDTFRALGLDLAEQHVASAVEDAKAFWNRRFFTTDYLKYDHAYPGAAHFARELYELGAHLIYLTGRDEPNMGVGTRANLIRDGFPWDAPRTHLLTKERAEIDDLTHKQEAADYVKSHGELIASFENEPLNLVALYEIFPKAMHVFVDTIASDRPAMPVRGLYRISGF